MSSDESSLTESDSEGVPEKKAKIAESGNGKKEKKKATKKVVAKSSDETSEDEEVQPTNKNNKKVAAKASSDESDDEPKVSKSSPKKLEKDGEGNELIPIGEKRFVSVSRFKGQRLIGIREYYQKDGKWMPGKKGISLSEGQYLAFKKIVPEIDKKMKTG